MHEPILNLPGYDTRSTHATLRVSDVTDKRNRWLRWCNVPLTAYHRTAVERKHQKRRSIIFLRRLCYKIYTKSSQRMNKNDVKTRCTYKKWISFFCCSSKYDRKVNVTPWASFTLHETHCVHTSMLCFTSDLILGPRFYITWKSENTKREASATFWWHAFRHVRMRAFIFRPLHRYILTGHY